ncbi:hypothetical protein [Synechocystis sp. LKSZ1]|uniref:phosphorylase family protein n=1 Tax=Synechocystis sp. LKSZ1 TaxID=3144951 RepID=UPI00336BF3DF
MLKDLLNAPGSKTPNGLPSFQLWVPQGAEYQAVRRGWHRRGLAANILALPVGSLAVTAFLTQWWQSRPVEVRPLGKIIVLGLAGSLSAEFSLGQPVLYQSCRRLGPSPSVPPAYLDAALTAFLHQQLAYPLVQGLTSDHVINQREEKMTLGQQYGRAVVDMEGIAVLAFCQAHGLPVAMLRVISDDIDQALPDLQGVYDNRGQLRPLALAGALVNQPRRGLHLIRSSLTALQALEQVAASLSELKF